jgi:hypothetical protein
MTDAEVAEITERLTRIERKLRRCRAALMGVALIAVAAAGRAAPSLLGAAEVPASIIRRLRSLMMLVRSGRPWRRAAATWD